MSETILIDVQIATDASSVPDSTEIQNWLQSAVAESTDGGCYEVSVRVVDETEGRSLNRQYRQIDNATNVLSFPSGADPLPDGGYHALGDIVLCAPVVEREAAEQGKAIADHWMHLLVHGALHLVGYDHESAADAERMEAVETAFLAARGIANPYRAKL